MTSEIRMRQWRGIAFLLALAALAVAGPVAAGCRLTRVAELPVKTAGGRVEIEAVIDGEPVALLVDTGASFSVLSPAAVKRLGLSIRDVNDHDLLALLGHKHAQSTEIQSLQLGALVGGRHRFMVSDDNLPDGTAIAGVLGEDVLSRVDVEFDLPHGVIRLFKTSGCGDAEMPYWATVRYSQVPLKLDADPLGGVYAMVEVNARPLTATFDTGATASMVRLSTAGAAGVEPVAGAGDEGATGAWVGMFDTVSVGDETVRNARVGLADEALYYRMTSLASQEGPQSGSGSGMIVGLDFFRSHRVLISPDHRMMYFTYEGGPVFRADSAGAAPPVAR